jgi:hypothetical protein
MGNFASVPRPSTGWQINLKAGHTTNEINRLRSSNGSANFLLNTIYIAALAFR